VKNFICIVLFVCLQSALTAGNNDKVSDKEHSTNKVVAGKIISVAGEAIAGTKLVIKETGETFFSDFDGNFRISIKKDQVYSISIETIGYQPKLVKSSELTNFSEVSLTEL